MVGCEGCKIKGVPVRPFGCINNPDIAFVGGYPTAQESNANQAFAGKAGKLLRELITALEINPSNIYYTHAVKCRQPKEKSPTASIIHSCQDNLIEELGRVSPKIVVPMGNEALTALLGGGRGISKRRGIFYEAHGMKIIPTLEPSRMASDSFIDLLTDLELIKNVLNGAKPIIEPPYSDYVLIVNQAGFNKLMDRLEKVGESSIDIETDGLDFQGGNILSIGFSWRRETACIVDWHNLVTGNEKNYNRMKEVLEKIDCYFHNAQFDTLWLRARGINPNLVGDTMLMHYTLDERQGSHGLKRLSIDRYRSPEYDDNLKAFLRARRKAREDGTPLKSVSADEDDRKAPLAITLEDWADEEVRRKVMLYNGADADYTWRLVEDLIPEMEEDGTKRAHDLILIPAVRHFTRLELEGMLVDSEYHDAMGRQWAEDMKKIEDELRSYPGAEDMNFNSPKQVSNFMFNVLNLTPMEAGKDGTVSSKTIMAEVAKYDDPEAQDYWKTASSTAYTGIKAKSTNTYMLYWLAQQSPWARLLIEHRDYAKLLGTYYDGYVALKSEDNRIRPRYRLHGTRTGRISSTDPNIHGMPRKNAIKNIFIADPGYTLIAADYSQAEIRMMAHFAQDDNLIKVMSETDIHRAISKQIFRLTEEQLSALPSEDVSFKRRAAKTIAFGLIYGRSAGSIAPQLGISVDEAEEYIANFFQMMPDVEKYIARQRMEVLKNHEVVSIYGRKRRFPYIADKSHMAEIQRQAVNMPIQSSVSDMTLLANMRILEKLEAEGISTKVFPHIHDGFVFQVPSEYVDRAVEVTKETMHHQDFKTNVHFAMEIEVGTRWGEMKTVYEG